ncbi:MAG: redoxin domain-containing protein [Planctomycetes bacterium]|nr:redoxin domain-containing protein [Planctomycetota bacterium]
MEGIHSRSVRFLMSRSSLASSAILVASWATAATGLGQAGSQELPAGHSSHGAVFNEGPRQRANLIPGCGAVHFPVRGLVDTAQQFFDQGVGQLHGFWYFEAERSFRQVAASAPECAMAYWGMAMANVKNADRAAGFVEQAVQRRGSASERERMWIDMLAKFYEVERGAADTKAAAKPAGKPRKRTFKRSLKERCRELVRGYEAVVERYPDDIEAKAFLANRMWLNTEFGLPRNGHMVVELMLQQVFAKNPMHPAHHYRIHLWDRENAARALVSARLSGQAAPGIAHQWHMSGHIFAKLHRHEDAAWQQAASARVDHAQMMRDAVMPYQIFNYGHNNEWLCRSLLHVGRVRDALALAHNMLDVPRHPRDNRIESSGSIAGYGVQRLIEACRSYRMHDRLVALCAAGELSGGDAPKGRLRVAADLGVAFFALGDAVRGDRQLAVVEQMLAALPPESPNKAKKGRDAKPAGRTTVVDAKGVVPGVVETTAVRAGARAPGGYVVAIAPAPAGGQPAATPDEDLADRAPPARKEVERRRDELRAMQHAVAGRRAEAEAALAKMGRIDAMARADALLRVGSLAKAMELLRERNKATPRRAEILARLVATAWRSDDRNAARAAFDELRKVAGRADLEVPLLQELSPVAAALDFPADWRLPQAPAADAGERPDLASLGPIHWRPSAAPPLDLPAVGGERLRLAEMRGRPVLLVFYLGFGCLHCVEQLRNLQPIVGELRAAGIDLVAVGTDSLESTSRSLLAMKPEERFAFPIAVDPELATFRRFRAHDDFEGKPLHGTFLIDAKGMVRWQDISYEPFDRPRFLLAECKRLLVQRQD